MSYVWNVCRFHFQVPSPDGPCCIQYLCDRTLTPTLRVRPAGTGTPTVQLYPRAGLGSHSDPLAAKVSLFSPPPLPLPEPPLPPLRRRRCCRRRRRRRRRHPHHLHHHLHHCHPHSHHPIPLSRHSGRAHVVRLSASTACTLSLPIAAPSTPFPLSRHTLFSTRMKKASPSSPGQSPPMQRQRRR